ncbi:ArsR/SmtB family transcription factor [Ilumatobacter nonamiensis]|uniref:ArsR/SmtB family transcription factor n=1 Tax=Ilumatobacter nonamiensis TaxID=467093 RepID=UPI00034D8A54|nr:metalloregulator ArsR/SmtB family transcription factor [Ilumatobacter nonamiensis]
MTSDLIDDSDTTETATAIDGSEACCSGSTGWMDRNTADELAARLSAAADPVRLQVLSIIAHAPGGEVCACDFVEPLGKSQPTVSHHLKVLTEAGLVEGDKRGRWIWYRLGPSAIDDLAGSLGAIVAESAATT